MQAILTTLLFTGMLATAAAQPKLIDQAVITTNTTVKATDTAQNKKLAAGMVLIANTKAEDPGETVSETWYAGNLVKTEVKRGNVATTTIRDNQTKKNVVYAELVKNDKSQKINSNGPKGFYASDLELQLLDQSKIGLSQQVSIDAIAVTHVKIDYEEDTKVIAGYPCKRAIVQVNLEDGYPKRIIAWYNTEVKLEGLPVTGDPIYGFLDARKNKTLEVLAQLKGFPMEYEMELAPGRTMKVTVTSLDITKRIKHPKFAIPENAQLSSFIAYMQNLGNYKINLGQIITRKKEALLIETGKSPD